MKKTLIVVSTLVGFFLFLFVMIKQIDILNIVKKLNWIYLIPFLTFSLLVIFCYVWRWKIILSTHKIKIGYFRLFLYKLSGFAVSYFTPSARIGGEAVRAFLLKQEKVKFHEAFSTILIDKYIEIATLIVLGAVGFLIIILNVAIDRSVFLIFTILIIFGLIGVYVFYRSTINNTPLLSRIIRKIRFKPFIRAAKSIRKAEILMSGFFKNKKKELNFSIYLTCMAFLLSFAEYYYLFKILGIETDLFEMFVVMIFVGFAYIFPIPAALGILEASQAGVFAALSYGTAIGVVLSLIIRFRDCFLSLIGLGYIIHRGIKKLGVITK